MHNPPKFVFYANRSARKGEGSFLLAKEALEQVGIRLGEARSFASASQLYQAIENAVMDRVDGVILGGGDGTLNLGLPCLLNSGIPLGVMPMGTGNQFARDLNIKDDLAHAAETISAGRVCAIDIGQVGDIPFLNVATLGLTTEIAKRLHLKKVIGRFAYAYAVGEALRKAKPFKVSLTIGNKTDEFEAVQVVVGNGRLHAGPFPVAHDATLFDGMLDTYAITKIDMGLAFRMALRMPLGHHIHLEDVPAYKTKEFLLKTDPPLPVTIDGETTWIEEMRFRVLAGGLKVFVPASFVCPHSEEGP
ncbi:MAG: YegS/Rv2252/BmrU family lipid kinase [Fimbriimonadaceae bacterium]|nr:YegS/Rv2252/BmrU family lipid kinase [Fimbriimonadaceae bacterium]